MVGPSLIALVVVIVVLVLVVLVVVMAERARKEEEGRMVSGESERGRLSGEVLSLKKAVVMGEIGTRLGRRSSNAKGVMLLLLLLIPFTVVGIEINRG